MSQSNEPFKPPTSPPPPINWATKPRLATATTPQLAPIFIDPDSLDDAEFSEEDLSSTLSLLSVTAGSTPSETSTSSSVPLQAANPPMFISSSLTSPSKHTSGASPVKKRKRYYVVTIGKCAGVFYDEWDNVKPLIEYVSGARYQSYPTHVEAVAAYQHSKAMGLVRIVRDPGDEEKYGSFFYAVQ